MCNILWNDKCYCIPHSHSRRLLDVHVISVHESTLFKRRIYCCFRSFVCLFALASFQTRINAKCLLSLEAENVLNGNYELLFSSRITQHGKPP